MRRIGAGRGLMGAGPASTFDPVTRPDDHEELRAAVRAVAEDKIAPYAAEVDAQSRFPIEAYDALRAADFHAPHIGGEYGGAGADAVATCIAIEEIARVCASTALIPAVNLVGTMPLILAGSEELRQRYLPPVAHGDALFSYGLTEREARSDTVSIGTRAVADGDEWVLTGQKARMAHAGVSHYYTVLAVTDPNSQRGGSVTAFVIEDGDAGFSFGEPERRLGVKGSPTRELFFDNVRLGDDRRIGEVGGGQDLALRALLHARVAIGAQALGIAQGALDHAVAYVGERQRFGTATAEFKDAQSMLVDMAVNLEAARQMVYAAVAKSERDDPDLVCLGAAAPCHASDVATRITTDAVHLLGGTGHVKDHPLERMARDATATHRELTASLVAARPRA